ncbi:MAG: hypothetical protein ACD_39C01497G0004 [uncultured bacterium]|nr:MAG: hypothetical protein ACD_39C01497G0004 [uncultured bacterium]
MKHSFRNPDVSLEHYLPEREKKRLEELRRKRDAWLTQNLGWFGKVLVIVNNWPRPKDPRIYW